MKQNSACMAMLHALFAAAPMEYVVPGALPPSGDAALMRFRAFT